MMMIGRIRWRQREPPTRTWWNNGVVMLSKQHFSLPHRRRDALGQTRTLPRQICRPNGSNAVFLYTGLGGNYAAQDDVVRVVFCLLTKSYIRNHHVGQADRGFALHNLPTFPFPYYFLMMGTDDTIPGNRSKRSIIGNISFSIVIAFFILCVVLTLDAYKFISFRVRARKKCRYTFFCIHIVYSLVFRDLIAQQQQMPLLNIFFVDEYIIHFVDNLLIYYLEIWLISSNKRPCQKNVVGWYILVVLDNFYSFPPLSSSSTCIMIFRCTFPAHQIHPCINSKQSLHAKGLYQH